MMATRKRRMLPLVLPVTLSSTRLRFTGLMLLLLVNFSLARQASKVVCVESWKKGQQQAEEQKFIINITPEQPNYIAVIKDFSGTARYKLVLQNAPVRERISFEWWEVKLYEESAARASLNQSSNYNLLRYERPDPAGDFLPMEDSIALLYPSEEPSVLKGDIRAYPISARRVIKVEGFYVIIQVLDYKFSSKNPQKLDSLVVQIQIANKYGGCAPTPPNSSLKRSAN